MWVVLPPLFAFFHQATACNAGTHVLQRSAERFKEREKERDPALRHGHGAQKIKLSAASTTDDDDPVSLEG